MDRESWDAIKKLGPSEPVPVRQAQMPMFNRGTKDKPNWIVITRSMKRKSGRSGGDFRRSYVSKSPRRNPVVDDTPRLSQWFRAIRRLSQASEEGRAS